MGLYKTIRHEIRWFLLHRLPTCERMLPLYSQSLERQLTIRERVVVYLHNLVCVWCQWYVEHLRFLRASAKEQGSVGGAEKLSNSIRLASDARERIRQRLGEARRAERDASDETRGS